MLPLITSPQNPKIKAMVKLRQRKGRERQTQMLVDGARAIELALKNGFQIEALYVAETALTAHAALVELARSMPVAIQPVTEAVFQKIGYGDNPDGVLAVAAQPAFKLGDLPRPPAPLFVVAEGLEKPGNLGAILRSADAAGVTGLIICQGGTDICNPNVIRASRGAFFTVPIAEAETAEALHWLREYPAQIVAASPAATLNYTQVDWRKPTAIALGAEHAGLTDSWFEEITVKIPMVGQVDSLNVAQCASVLIFEAVRQRSALS